MPRSGNHIVKELQHGERTRSYHVHLPPAYAPGTPLPLVVSLHGGGGNARSNAVQTGFDAESDRGSFIVVHPNGTGEHRPLLNAVGRGNFFTWNAGSCCGYAMRNEVDDVGFLRAMLAELQRDYAVDPRRIYASGFSNGGMMSYRLACEMSDVFAAIGVVSGAQTAYECRPAQPVSVIHIHGNADQNVMLGGGVGAKALEKVPKPPVMEGVEFWVRHNGCGTPHVEHEGRVLKTLYGNGRGGTEVAFHLIENGGHAWPGGNRLLPALDEPSRELDATPLIWQFFAAHPKQASGLG